ncbi:sensor histidine kinase [Cohnella faecalis]|uniref:sensor histidine kinase n=1 Tax=Cohnella faecalis TaxID=2315694 RepID=UPI001F324CF9|nr:ATP-binding protein [Cohnella faecalis]
MREEQPSVIRIAVEDNGCGMSRTKAEQLLKPEANHKGVGLFNINQRIKLIYGGSLRIDSEESMGTKVTFDIPVEPTKITGG